MRLMGLPVTRFPGLDLWDCWCALPLSARFRSVVGTVGRWGGGTVGRSNRRTATPNRISMDTRLRVDYLPTMRYALTAYIEAALELACYDKLEDGTFAGEIPRLHGVVAFADNLRQCERELRSVLEDWILVGLRLGHRLPRLAGVDLNRRHGRVEANQAA
jgi:predicted RNase H-like HicB family nuclease